MKSLSRQLNNVAVYNAAVSKITEAEPGLQRSDASAATLAVPLQR